MAIQRVAFGAEEADAMADGFIDDAVDPARNSGLFRHRLVVGDAVTIKFGSRGRPPSASPSAT